MASDEFIRACSDAQKAWHQTNLLSITKSKVIARVKQILKNGDVKEVLDLLLEIMGPVAPINLKDAMSSATVAHREMAGIIAKLSIQVVRNQKSTEEAIDMQRVKSLIIHWIDHGELSLNKVDPVHVQARRINDLFQKSDVPERIRLAICSPLAPAIESMIVISRLNDSIIDVFAKTSEKLNRSKIIADNLVKQVCKSEK